MATRFPPRRRRAGSGKQERTLQTIAAFLGGLRVLNAVCAREHLFFARPDSARSEPARWFAPHVAYTMAKFGMSMCTLGIAEELKVEQNLCLATS